MVATGASPEADASGETQAATRFCVRAAPGRDAWLYYVLRTKGARSAARGAGEEDPVPRVADDPKWTDPGLLVMGSLAGGPKHGYAMVRDVEESTGVRLGPGTLYGAIARLESRGLIEALDGDDSRRRPYRLTARGVEVLERQLAGMQRFAGVGRRRLARLSPSLRGAS